MALKRQGMLGRDKTLSIVVVDKEPERTDVILELFGKGQCFADEAGTTLTESVIEAFDMVGQASLFADRTMPFGRKDFGIGLPEIGVEDRALSILRW